MCEVLKWTLKAYLLQFCDTVFIDIVVLHINAVGHHRECGSLGTREVSLGCSSPKSV